jgi:hypothetical protein
MASAEGYDAAAVPRPEVAVNLLAKRLEVEF